MYFAIGKMALISKWMVVVVIWFGFQMGPEISVSDCHVRANIFSAFALKECCGSLKLTTHEKVP